MHIPDIRVISKAVNKKKSEKGIGLAPIIAAAANIAKREYLKYFFGFYEQEHEEIMLEVPSDFFYFTSG